jgi:hypothetical protein
MPTSTNSIAKRSNSERGLSAERIPTGIEIKSQKNTPPKTSEAVTRASWAMIHRTDTPFWNEKPSDW